MSNMAAQQQQQQQQEQQLEGIHRYKISPPRFAGECNTFEEWKYKMTAYLGLQDPAYNSLLRQPEQPIGQVTNDQLENAAPPQHVAERWIQLSNNNLHYILVSTRERPASTTCRQNIQGNGFETWRRTHARYSMPLGTRSSGLLTRLLKPQLDEQKFEESFTTAASRKHHNRCTDHIHGDRILQSNSIIHQATRNHIRQQQPRTGTDGHRSNMIQQRQRKERHKGEGKYNKGKGYGGYGNNCSYNNYRGRKGKRNQQPVTGWTRKSFQMTTRILEGKGHSDKGKGYNNQQGGKGAKGKHATNVCHRCGQPGHMAKQCRVAIYNCDTGNCDTNDQADD